MNARTEYQLSSADLDVVLALVRAGTLAQAGERLGCATSSVFRALQKIERGLGQPLFGRSRSGLVALELAQTLAGHAEQMEAQIESARLAAQLQPDAVAGTVRITSTDTVLHGLLAQPLRQLHASHPRLMFDLHVGNELASLSRRDADIAVRATKKPPPHLVGKCLGPIRVALFAAQNSRWQSMPDVEATGDCHWIAPDDALPEHPSVIWRQKRYPKVVPAYRVGAIGSVLELVAQGLGVGVLPLFLAQQRADLRQLGAVLDECETQLWLLTHTEARHLRRVATVFKYLAQVVRLE
jgi:DNA-binding transcriptional LysR family regulator